MVDVREQKSMVSDQLLQDAATVECRYCCNLDHWVPNAMVVTQIECRHCSFCPMYVLEHQWAEHKEHNGNIDAPAIMCLECPECGGPILPDAQIAECRHCALCDKYIPLTKWDDHLRGGCYSDDNPFA